MDFGNRDEVRKRGRERFPKLHPERGVRAGNSMADLRFHFLNIEGPGGGL